MPSQVLLTCSFDPFSTAAKPAPPQKTVSRARRAAQRNPSGENRRRAAWTRRMRRSRRSRRKARSAWSPAGRNGGGRATIATSSGFSRSHRLRLGTIASITTSSIRKTSQITQFVTSAIRRSDSPVPDSSIATTGMTKTAAVRRTQSNRRPHRSLRSSTRVGSTRTAARPVSLQLVRSLQLSSEPLAISARLPRREGDDGDAKSKHARSWRSRKRGAHSPAAEKERPPRMEVLRLHEVSLRSALAFDFLLQALIGAAGLLLGPLDRTLRLFLRART